MTNLSKTQINLYQRCPYAYYCRYIEGLKIKPSSSILMGSSLDSAINMNYTEKIKTKKDEPVSVVKDCFAEYYDKEKGNTIFDDSEKPEQLKDVGVKVTEVFHQIICKDVQPTEVQIRDDIVFENVDYKLLVVIDLIDSGNIVVDNKYASKMWASGKEFQELDPVIYSLWYETKKSKEENKFRFDLGIGSKIPRAERIERKVTRSEKDGFLKYLACIHEQIEENKRSGIFLPRTDHFLCSRKKCGYFSLCEKEWGHRIKD